jgi:hypothetical protein
MKRKHSHKVMFKISRAQIEAVERQYWAKYNNSELNSMLLHTNNTKSIR